jgi:peptidoglycan/xylan/chitin deacetylase (PgdA/CDA1 family)
MERKKTIGIAVHVDTFEGMKRGVPVLLGLFRKYGVKASFFVPMGKDHTGRTIKRIFRRKGFLEKSGTGRVWATAVGTKTFLYGLLLPGPEIARKNRKLLRQITGEGHELGIHGSDHVYWHDHIKGFDRKKTEKEISVLLKVYKELTGVDARSFAAPGWMINSHVLRYFQERGLAYSSDTRNGRTLFFPEMGGERFRVLQIPTTMPTLDEVIGSIGTDVQALIEYYHNVVSNGLNILTVHAEIEGNRWTGFLEGFIKKTVEDGFAYRRLIDIAEEHANDPGVSVCSVEYGFVSGRSGEVCLQGKESGG